MDLHVDILDDSDLEDFERPLDPAIPTAVLHTLHALLQGRGRSSSSRIRNRRQNFRDALALAMRGRSFLRFDFGPGGTMANGSALPPSTEALEISRLLREAGMASLVVRGLPEPDELDRFAVVLETHFRRRLQWDADIALFPRLNAAGLRCLNFVFDLPRGVRGPAGEFGVQTLSADRNRNPWDLELLVERCRRIDLEFGLTLLEDLEEDPTNEVWRSQVLDILARLFEFLVGKRRYRVLLPLIDRALASKALGEQGQRELRRTLDGFGTPDRLERFLRALSSGAEPALVEFLERLGPGIAPYLLAQEENHGSRTLHGLLQRLTQRDPKPLLDLCGAGDVRLEQRAISYLLDCEGALPPAVLADLARSEVGWIRDRARKRLEGRQPGTSESDEATALLHDAQEWIRIQGLRRLRSPEFSTCASELLRWFDGRQRTMAFVERREFFTTLAVLDPGTALPVLRRWIERMGPRRRRSDHDNRICAVHALGSLPGEEARNLLLTLTGSEDPELRQTAQQTLASRSEDRDQ